MEINDKIFLENILKLTTELDGVEGFGALVTVNEIELLFENYKNELIQYLKKELEIKEENIKTLEGKVNAHYCLAVEFGYKQCEKGNNIQMAVSEWNKI